MVIDYGNKANGNLQYMFIVSYKSLQHSGLSILGFHMSGHNFYRFVFCSSDSVTTGGGGGTAGGRPVATSPSGGIELLVPASSVLQFLRFLSLSIMGWRIRRRAFINQLFTLALIILSSLVKVPVTK